MGRARVVVALTLILAVARLADADARRVVEAFVERLSKVEITDLSIQQTITLYHPEGRYPASTGEQQLLWKLPGRERLEQSIEGQREVRLTVGDRMFVRRADGKVTEASAPDRGRLHVVTPFRRSVADLLAEWRSLGVREDVTHQARMRGRPVTVIGAAAGDRQSPAVWFDDDYGVIRLITRESLSGRPTLVDVTFSEHRPLVSGFFFPYRQEAYVDGKMILLVTVRSIDVNKSLPDALFDPDELRRAR